MKTTIQIDGKEIKVRLNFQHSQFYPTTPTRFPNLKGITECHLETDDNTIVGIGIANCTINDCFCKETGRKIALARAVSTLPKSERKKIWKAYLNRAT